jgi:hypothetical protein
MSPFMCVAIAANMIGHVPSIGMKRALAPMPRGVRDDFQDLSGGGVSLLGVAITHPESQNVGA